MKKTILKRLFIKICKILDFEIIDQNEFNSPTLEKELNEDLSIINNKSIVLPLGEVKITKKIKSSAWSFAISKHLRRLHKFEKVCSDFCFLIISL